MKKQIYPSIGSVLTGTMREEDLIPAFMDVLREYVPKVAKTIEQENKDVFAWLEDTDQDQPEFLSEFLNETLWDALNDLCPPYVYFGASEGDGCDYGFWPDIAALEEAVRFHDGVVKINAGDPLPEGGTDYSMTVTDHGNVTLYDAEGNELWSCV